MSFTFLNIQQEYSSPQNNIVTEFYIPVLEKSVTYKLFFIDFFSSNNKRNFGINKIIQTN